MENETKRTVIVTGFTPFGEYTVNASWEAVKLLPYLFKAHEKSSEINLHIEEIPVVYKDVVETVGTLWEKHRPFVSNFNFFNFFESKKFQKYILR